MSDRKRLIGICGKHLFNENSLQFINQLNLEGLKRNYYSIAFSTNTEDSYDTDEIMGENQLFELLQYVDLSGIVILAEKLKNKDNLEKILQAGKEKNIPVFVIDGKIEGCYNFELNYNSGFEKSVRHVIEDHGCKKIVMMAGHKDNPFSESRIEAYQKVLKEYNIPFEEKNLLYGNFWDWPTRVSFTEYLESGNDLPQAVICANDTMAMTVCSVLNDFGYQVPEDVIVTGFDGTLSGKNYFPSLTTCEPDYSDAIKNILDEIETVESTKTISPYNDGIDFVLSENQSCGCEEKTYQNVNKVISGLSYDVGDCGWHNLAMNDMVTSVLNKKNIKDIADALPSYMYMWTNNFRFACVKSSIFDFCDLEDGYSNMTSMVRVMNKNYERSCEVFSIEEFIPGLMDVFNKEKGINTIIVTLLHSGKDIYGYLAEGFDTLRNRELQRCNEFAMFLSHSINTVVHNYKLTQAYDQIAAFYIRDAMTNVFNRRGFFQKVEEIIRKKENQNKYLSVYSIDMNRLKYINDNFGHAEGDFAITALSEALLYAADDSAICARLGGDEFICVTVTESFCEEQLAVFSEKVNSFLEKECTLNGKCYDISASIGMSHEKITQDINIEDIMMEADKCMYQVKNKKILL